MDRDMFYNSNSKYEFKAHVTGFRIYTGDMAFSARQIIAYIK